MKNLDNVLELLVNAKTINGTSFIGIQNYFSKSSGNTANYTILGGFDFEKVLLNDFQALQENESKIFNDENLLKEFGKDMISKAYFELMESLEKRLSDEKTKNELREQNDSTINRSDAQIDAYIHWAKGVKQLKNSGEFYVFGLEINKVTLIKGEKKADTRQAKTKCKDSIKFLCEFKELKYRNFKFNIADVKIKGTKIENLK